MNSAFGKYLPCFSFSHFLALQQKTERDLIWFMNLQIVCMPGTWSNGQMRPKYNLQ